SEPESGSETTSVVSRGDPKWGWVGARQASRTPTPSSNAVVTETDLIIVTGQTPSPTAPSSASTTSSYPIVTGIPYVASSHLGIGRISYVVPFVFYIMAIINASVLLLTLLGTFRGYSRRSFLNFSIAGCCFIALLFGNAILTSASRNAISRLTTGESALYVPSSSISMNSTFMGISWGSTVAMFVATIMMAWEWNVERFTPP
ncbi:hypothetical protein DH86_00003573, partial [Scytalidium sp. 3C]